MKARFTDEQIIAMIKEQESGEKASCSMRSSVKLAGPMLRAGCETGLRAADLVQVKMDQFENTPHGKRLRFRTSKRGQIAYKRK